MITFQLLSLLAEVKQVDQRLFIPKLIETEMFARRPDMFLNSTVNAYVECVMTKSGNTTELDLLIADFSQPKPRRKSSRRRVWRTRRIRSRRKSRRRTCITISLNPGTYFAVLNFQVYGTTPLQPSPWWSDVFNERVFTYVMPTKKLFLGNTCLTPAPQLG
jgi:hypothetical protein